HAGRGFPQARRRVADHRFPGKPFDDESSQFVEVDDILELNAVAEGSAGCNNRVLQLNASEAHAEIDTATWGGGHRGCSVPRAASVAKAFHWQVGPRLPGGALDSDRIWYLGCGLQQQSAVAGLIRAATAYNEIKQAIVIEISDINC